MPPKFVLGLAAGLCASLIWGGHAVVARAALTGQGLIPLDLAAFRYGVAGLLLLPVLWQARLALAEIGLRRLLVLTAAVAADACIEAQGSGQIVKVSLPDRPRFYG